MPDEIISNYWILQIKEGVIYRGRRPRWITPFEICRILHILRKPNSIHSVSPLRSLFFRSPNIIQPCPQVFSVNGSIICSGLHFWRHFDVIGSIIFGGLHFWRHWFNMAKILYKFGEQQLVMVNYARGFNQSETGKYFEWIIPYVWQKRFQGPYNVTFSRSESCLRSFASGSVTATAIT